MKKMILSFVAAMIAATATIAQTSLVATLNHDGAISVFNGQSALANAMAAAAHGDMITLSSGTFAATDISKAVTLRGTGIAEDETGQYITRVTGNFYLTIPDDATAALSVEGISFTGTITKKSQKHKNATFSKCKFTTITTSGHTAYPAVGWRFVNCYITTGIVLSQGTGASFVNCCVFNPENHTADSNPSSLEFTNCLVVSNSTKGFQSSIGFHNSKFYNCFIFKTSTNSASKALYGSHEAYNCVGYDALGTEPIFGNINKATNTELTAEEYNALFKSGTFYELTEEAQAKYLGNDDREVGLYGGVLPYSTRIANPQITKCNVARKTTTDGKLSVDIAVKAADE